MPTHNLARLSSLDFEELTHDLLEADWKVPLETFKSGADGGIDLRHIASNQNKTIVQCKHYIASGLSKLVSDLKTKELPKVKSLAPDRYVLVTSLPLSPQNKKDILEALDPHVKNSADIIGSGEIEALLRKHPAVEITHYKLWLTSTAVLERVLHSAERCHASLVVDKISRKLPLYVQNDSYPRAIQILKESKIVVVSGPPGIGKSTLAEMLIYAHLEEGYELVTIQAETSEARKLYRPDRKQLFYFDDFLGQTFFGDRTEYLGRNEDSALSDFLDAVRQSNDARFILTTREHILGGAFQRSEKLRNSALIDARCVISLDDYQRSQKARILYNHLWFSDLPIEYKEALLTDDFFLSIIDHENFNPRLIEWLSAYSRVKLVLPGDYQNHITQLLAEPELIWAQAFEHQISKSARNILTTLYSVGSAETKDLEIAWAKLHQHNSKRCNYSVSPSDFRDGLKELDGTFISIEGGKVSLLNPSVRDFVASRFNSDAGAVLDILETAVRFRQVSSLWKLSTEPRFKNLKSHLLSNGDIFFSALTRLLPGPYVQWKNVNGAILGNYIDDRRHVRAELAIQIANELSTDSSISLAILALDSYISSWTTEWFSFYETIDLIHSLNSSEVLKLHGGTQKAALLTDAIVTRLDAARANDWFRILEADKSKAFPSTEVQAAIQHQFKTYCEDGVTNERLDCEDISEMERMKDYLELIVEKHSADLDKEISALEENISELTEPVKDDEGSALSKGLSASDNAGTSDLNIRNIFRTLILDHLPKNSLIAHR